MSFRHYMQALLGLLYPTERLCIACHSLLPEAGRDNPKKTQSGNFRRGPQQTVHNHDWVAEIAVCDSCLHELRPIEPPYCLLCGRHLAQSLAERPSERLQRVRCPECERETPFVLARAYGEYQGTLRDLLHRLKFSKEVELLEVLAPFFHEAWNRHMAHFPIDLLVPVPAHPERLRERGYNQAELFAKSLSLYTHIPYASVLLRTIHLSGHASRTRHERLHALQDSYQLEQASSNLVNGRRILLLDDIYTTGSTAEACAHALQQGGAAQVYVLTLAR